MCTRAFIGTKINTPDPSFKVTVGKIGDFWLLSRQYLKNG